MLKYSVTPSLLFITLFTLAGYAFAGPHAYVPNEKDGNVSVIDTEIDKVIGKLPAKGRLGKKIQAAAIDPTGEKLYVVVRDANAVAQIDVKTQSELQRLEVGDEPEGISISPDGKTLAACLEEENAVSFVDLSTFKLKATVKTLGKNPEHCVFSPDGKWLLASNEQSGDVDVIDAVKLASVTRIQATKHPRGIGFSPDSQLAYVANEAANLLEVVQVSDWKVIKKFQWVYALTAYW